MSKLSIVIAVVFLSISSGAKAPLSSDESVPKVGKKRYPAGLNIISLDDYLDMECLDFYKKSSKDEFIIFTRKRFNSVSKSFCDQVDDSSVDVDISQDQLDTIGAGTFSKLIESYYNEFKYEKQMSYLLGQECEDLINPEANGKFAIFFKKYIDQLSPSLCELIEPDQPINEGSIEAQREHVGQGTFSKIVEQAFDEYSYLKE